MGRIERLLGDLDDATVALAAAFRDSRMRAATAGELRRLQSQARESGREDLVAAIGGLLAGR